VSLDRLFGTFSSKLLDRLTLPRFLNAVMGARSTFKILTRMIGPDRVWGFTAKNYWHRANGCTIDALSSVKNKASGQGQDFSVKAEAKTSLSLKILNAKDYARSPR